MAKEQFTLDYETALAECKTGKSIRSEFYGDGWTTIFDGKEFWDRNPVTGSLLLHDYASFDKPRNREAKWRVVA